MSADLEPNSEVLFRPAKRKKYLRRRPDLEESVEETQAPDAPQPPQDVASVIQSTDTTRIRRVHRPRKGGIEFSTTPRTSADHDNQVSTSVVTAEDPEHEKVLAMNDRFTAHTGQTVDVDKHMMAFIESEMAKRYRHGIPRDVPDSEMTTPNKFSNGPSTSELPQRQPASLGKLHEIDLGQETKLQNIARTEAATRKIQGDEEEPPESDSNPGLAKDGKHRNRKRRTSADIERDRLVEEVLRESKLDVYDEPLEEKVTDQAADDKIADQFRREFFDAIQSRRRVARARHPKKDKPDIPRGPKLGGSRLARAAMREMQGKSAKK